MNPELIVWAAVAMTLFTGAIVIAERTWKPIRRYLLRRPESQPATGQDIEEVKRALDELKEIMTPPEGAAEMGTEELAKEAGPDTAARLREALEFQAQNREREAIDCLYEAFRKDLRPRAKAQLHGLLGDSFWRLSELEEAESHTFRRSMLAAPARRRNSKVPR